MRQEKLVSEGTKTLCKNLTPLEVQLQAGPTQFRATTGEHSEIIVGKPQEPICIQPSPPYSHILSPLCSHYLPPLPLVVMWDWEAPTGNDPSVYHHVN